MNDKSPKIPKELGERRREILRGKPLYSRPRWLLLPFSYIALLIIGVIVLITYVDGVWLAVGLTVLALGGSLIPEMIADLRYSRYRQEWEIANGGGADLNE
jgi:hypothetical protein